MAFKRIFSYAKVDVPNRSGHNVDHRHAFSAKCGTLVPSFSDFLIPGDTVDLSPKFSVQMAPQATDFIGRISLRTELFFVPLRAIWGGWKDFITYASEGIGGPAPDDPNYHAKYLPGALVPSAFQPRTYHSKVQIPLDPEDENVSSKVTDSLLDFVTASEIAESNEDYSFYYNSNSTELAPGTLADYLGFKVNNVTSGDTMPYLVSYLHLVNALKNTILYDFDKLESLIRYITVQDVAAVYLVDDELKVAGGVPSGTFGFTFRLYTEQNTLTRRLYVNVYPGDTVPQGDTPLQINNILPFVAYHKIYDDWYRDARLMKKLFPNALGDSPNQFASSIPYITKFGAGFNKKMYQGDGLKFYDDKTLFDLRQRLWQKDFFTTMTQAPQSGDAMKVQVTPDADNPAISGEFTIASLRLANAMQLWRERNNLVDSRYGDVQYAQYGVYPSDAVTDRAIYLGSNTVEIYNKSVYQQGQYDGPSNNPIKGIGTKYATPVGVGQGNLCNNYSVTEHGILMALTSIVPEPSYSSGTRRVFHYNSIEDIAFPLLQGVGDQPVYAREIIDTYSGEGDKTVIGYTGRYSEYKFINDHISGLLRDGESLSAFALQRSFSQPPVLGADFLEIPEDYLDQVSAVGVENSKYGAWIESYWRYSKVSCLSEYNAVPTLGRMPDVHQITVTKAGSRL